jgi:hypothetical protein
MANDLKVILSHNGVDIVGDEQGLINLTNIWKSKGADESKAPAEWRRSKQAAEFLAVLSRNVNMGIPTLWKTRRGKGLAGTWAHWQAALAYTKWLDPDFHQNVNAAFVRWAQEEKNPTLKIERGVEKLLKQGVRPEWVKTRFDGIVVRKEFTGTLQDHNCRNNGKHDNPFAEATRSITLAAIGKTPKEFRSEKGLTKKSQLTRNHMSERELIRIQFAESEATHMIREEAADGNKQCLDCVRTACDAVRAVVRSIEQRKPSTRPA